MNESIDIRVVKTLDSIKYGFGECIKQKPFTKITIKDIITVAKINRTTFYKYYEDKFQLRDSLVNSSLAELSKQINLPLKDIRHYNIENLKDIIIEQLNFMIENKDWYLILWNKNMELNLYQDIQQIFESKIREFLLQKLKNDQTNTTEFSEKHELFARLFASSAMTTVKWWYEVSPKMTSNDIANIIINNLKIGMYRAFL